jgi:hypothetical protein
MPGRGCCCGGHGCERIAHAAYGAGRSVAALRARSRRSGRRGCGHEPGRYELGGRDTVGDRIGWEVAPAEGRRCRPREHGGHLDAVATLPREPEEARSLRHLSHHRACDPARRSAGPPTRSCPSMTRGQPVVGLRPARRGRRPTDRRRSPPPRRRPRARQHAPGHGVRALRPEAGFCRTSEPAGPSSSSTNGGPTPKGSTPTVVAHAATSSPVVLDEPGGLRPLLQVVSVGA